MRLLNKSGAILLPLMLSACATRGTPPIADSACLSFDRISYAVPPRQADGTRDLKTDDGNRYDTPATVAEISAHNARFDAVCQETKR